jgi:glucans biosynthesis protein C
MYETMVHEPHVSVMPARQTPRRRYELDWLRVLVIIGLVPFHVAIIFISGPHEYVASAQTSVVMRVLVAFLALWGMPLLFVISGAGSWFALESRSGWQYLRERLSRLALPFLVGILVIVPPQVYYGNLSNPAYHQSYLQFYWGYLLQNLAILKGSPPNNLIYLWGHLWFIPLLLLFSFVALPLFLPLKTPRGRRWLTVFATTCNRIPGGILLLGLPIVGSEVVVHEILPRLIASDYLDFTNWGGFLLFLLSFLLGYLLYSNADIERALRRDGPIALVLGLGCFMYEETLILTHSLPAANTPADFAILLMHGCSYWLWIIVFLAIGVYFFQFKNALLRYLDDASFPWYVLHLPILTIIGFYVTRTQFPLGVQFLAIALPTYGLMYLLFEFPIRRIPLLRTLFGLKRAPVLSE